MSKNKAEKSLASIITGDVNTSCKNWWSQEVSNSQAYIIDTLTSLFGYHQLLNLPTHMTHTSSFCIDLIFTSKTLYTYSSHHSIAFGKMNLNLPLPTPYTREVCGYNKGGKKISREV